MQVGRTSLFLRRLLCAALLLRLARRSAGPAPALRLLPLLCWAACFPQHRFDSFPPCSRIYLTAALGVLQPLCAFLALLMLTAGLRYGACWAPGCGWQLCMSSSCTPAVHVQQQYTSMPLLLPLPTSIAQYLPAAVLLPNRSRRHRPEALRHPNARLLGLAALCTLPVAAVQVGLACCCKWAMQSAAYASLEH